MDNKERLYRCKHATDAECWRRLLAGEGLWCKVYTRYVQNCKDCSFRIDGTKPLKD